jgi:ribosomal protein L34E
MARFYDDVPIQWKEGETTHGRGLGNHVAWRCKCDHLMLAPHEELYFVPPCPTCGRKFRVVKGKKPRYVKRVIERAERPYRPT